jgi:hypothetical protein
MAHDDTEQGVATSPEEEDLAPFHLHEELDERRDRNDDKPESEVQLELTWDSSSLTLRFSGQPFGYVDLVRTMETMSFKKPGYPTVICV